MHDSYISHPFNSTMFSIDIAVHTVWASFSQTYMRLLQLNGNLRLPNYDAPPTWQIIFGR